MKKVIVIGAGGHGRVVADIIRLNGDMVCGFLDDKKTGGLPGINVLGEFDLISSLVDDDYYFIVAVGNNQVRSKIMESYPKAQWYTAIHPSAVLADDVEIGAGSAIMANAVVNCNSKIGRGVIINTAATVDHDNVIGDFVHISPGVHLGGTVCVGNRSWIGMGANVINNINICSDCIIGAGAVVIKNIIKTGTYIGVPAKMFLNAQSTHE